MYCQNGVGMLSYRIQGKKHISSGLLANLSCPNLEMFSISLSLEILIFPKLNLVFQVFHKFLKGWRTKASRCFVIYMRFLERGRITFFFSLNLVLTLSVHERYFQSVHLNVLPYIYRRNWSFLQLPFVASDSNFTVSGKEMLYSFSWGCPPNCASSSPIGPGRLHPLDCRWSTWTKRTWYIL